jgi:two-component system, chemotaxis family, CheB/CheR fusion protein
VTAGTRTVALATGLGDAPEVNPKKTTGKGGAAQQKKKVLGSGRKTTPRPAAKAKASEPDGAKPVPPVPIVGIGASAGGLEAFTQLLTTLPADTGLAFVLVQHLDPRHDSMLADLLSHATDLPIHEVRDGMSIEANHVYVIPPNTNMAVLHGRLSLMPRTETRGQHMPVDFFLRSLAHDQGSHAIGVILSGTASDGTEGLKAIKAEGGLTFAQDRKSAKYDGMPHSAISAGVVDFVLAPEKIASELARLGRHPYVASLKAALQEDPLPESAEDLDKVFILLRSATGVDFTYYKPTTLKRRIARRMVLHKIESLAHYVRFLKQTPSEADALYQDLLINVTRFFRDPETFEALKKKIFPRLLKNRPPQSPIRIWVPGCATGEEAYSLAIVLMETLGGAQSGVPVQIFGTDISDRAIEHARLGIYPESIASDVSAARLRRFFVKNENGWQISKSIRDLCVFARQDVTKDPPFSKLDLVSCRNLLIYMGPVLQKKVIPTFHYALKANGILMLGGSETIGGFADLFALADKKLKFYARKPSAHRMEFELPLANRRPMGDEPDRPATTTGTGFDFQKEADRLVLAKFAPAGVLVNEHLDILQFRGHTGRYLEPASGTASLNLLKMAREGLLLELRSALTEAKRRNTAVHKPSVQIKSSGGFREVDIEVVPLKPSPSSKAGCFLVLFNEVLPTSTQPNDPKERSTKSTRDRSAKTGLLANQLQQELTATKEYLQSVIEDQERTNEELQSANEEILSSNEELQSTNEELETAKEELQSTNEELTTVNDELHTRNAELGQANNDLVNLLNSVQIPIVMLGGDLRIRRFTPMAERVMSLIPTDIGRPLSDLRPNIIVPELEKLIIEVMDTLAAKELEVQDREGRWCLLRIRPYKTLENRIDGVVVALVDIDALKRVETEVREAREFAEAIVETVREPLLVLDKDLRVKSANHNFYRMFQTKPAETVGGFIYDVVGGRWNDPKLRELLEEILPKNSRFEDFEVAGVFQDSGPRKLRLNARRLAGEDNKTQLILLAMEKKA